MRASVDLLLSALNDILLSALLSSAVVVADPYLWSWSRAHYRFLFAGMATFLGFTAWNLVQSSTGADLAFNIDWPIFPLSWSDVGSGVAAFVATVTVLGSVIDRNELAWHILAVAGIAGLLALLVDLFVL